MYNYTPIMTSVRVTAIVLGLWTPRAALSQSVIWQVSADKPYIYYGPVENIGDVNLDNANDIIVGAGGADTDTFQNAGKAILYSGRNGDVLATIWGSSSFPGAGAAVGSIDDITNDGVREICVFSGSTTTGANIYLGGTTAILYPSIQGGFSTASIGDLDGDSVSDFCIGGTGSITAYSASNASPLWSVPVSVSLLRSRSYDFNGDGIGDLIGNHPGSLPDHPAVSWVLSGKGDKLLYVFYDQWIGGQWAHHGLQAISPGDINGDRIPDLAISQEKPSYLIHFYSGATGAEFATLPGWGYIMFPAGDLDGDGVGDIISRGVIIPGISGLGAISGRTRKVLYSFNVSLGTFLTTGAPMGDVNGDDFPDYVWAGEGGLTTKGNATMFSGAPIGITTFGTGCPGDNELIPRIGCGASAKVGSKFELNLSRVTPGVRAWLFVGSTSTLTGDPNLPFDLAIWGMPGCELIVSPDQSYLVNTLEFSPDQGYATVSQQIPNAPSLIGASFYAQWIVANTNAALPGSASRGLKITIQP